MFDFLGFTHYCATSRGGKIIVKRKTQRKLTIRKLKETEISRQFGPWENTSICADIAHQFRTELRTPGPADFTPEAARVATHHNPH